MKRGDRQAWTLARLAEDSGIPARTIRYYIARGLLEGPAVAGRGAEYTRGHLERLQTIQRLQSQGAMLADIAQVLAGVPDERPLPEPEAWHQYALSEDVVVLVRGAASPWRTRRIKKAIADFAANIKGDADHEGGN